MKGWKCRVIAAAASLKIPQREVLVFPAFDCWQITIVVGDCPGCVIHLDRFRWPYVGLVSFSAALVLIESLPVEPEE